MGAILDIVSDVIYPVFIRPASGLGAASRPTIWVPTITLEEAQREVRWPARAQHAIESTSMRNANAAAVILDVFRVALHDRQIRQGVQWESDPNPAWEMMPVIDAPADDSDPWTRRFTVIEYSQEKMTAPAIPHHADDAISAQLLASTVKHSVAWDLWHGVTENSLSDTVEVISTQLLERFYYDGKCVRQLFSGAGLRGWEGIIAVA